MRPVVRISSILVALVFSACGMGTTAEVNGGITDQTVLDANAEDMAATDTVEQEVTTPFGISGTHSASQLTTTVILHSNLNNPSSMAFKPGDGSLWIMNQGNDS